MYFRMKKEHEAMKPAPRTRSVYEQRYRGGTFLAPPRRPAGGAEPGENEPPQCKIAAGTSTHVLFGSRKGHNAESA
jgi:hypothetical protein